MFFSNIAFLLRYIASLLISIVFSVALILYYKFLSIFSHTIKLSSRRSLVNPISWLVLKIIFSKFILTCCMVLFCISIYALTRYFNDTKLIINSFVYFILKSNRSNFLSTNELDYSISRRTYYKDFSWTSNRLSTYLNIPISNIFGSPVIINVSCYTRRLSACWVYLNFDMFVDCYRMRFWIGDIIYCIIWRTRVYISNHSNYLTLNFWFWFILRSYLIYYSYQNRIYDSYRKRVSNVYKSSKMSISIKNVSEV